MIFVFKFILFIFSLDITKFFGYEFSTAVRMDEKENRYMISGVHEYGTLQKALEKFIDRFVLCPICDNPETELVCLLLNIRLEMIDTVINMCIYFFFTNSVLSTCPTGEKIAHCF
jgi:hypothetical protein